MYLEMALHSDSCLVNAFAFTQFSYIYVCAYDLNKNIHAVIEVVSTSMGYIMMYFDSCCEQCHRAFSSKLDSIDYDITRNTAPPSLKLI